MSESEDESEHSGELVNTILLFRSFISNVETSFECGLFVSTAWTTANLQQLFTAMKNSISDRDRDCLYYKGLKSLPWEKVAFAPFSASECEGKWMGILRKVGYDLLLNFWRLEYSFHGLIIKLRHFTVA